MKNLVFQRLIVISKSQKKGNQFKFASHLNLITAKNNSYGKSTLAKLLVWTLGCEPYLDETWQNLDVHCRVDFNIEKDDYRIERYKNTILLYKSNKSCIKYTKIGGEYSQTFAQIVGFEALLPQRRTNSENKFILETPPPAFYYLPFYIDQQYSWSKAWDSFRNLGQYSRWYKNIIKYHTGYLVPQHFILEKQIASERTELEEKKETQKQIDKAIEVVKYYIPSSSKTIALSEEEFDSLTREASEDISRFQTEQENLLKNITKYKSRRAFLLSQLDLANIAIDELEKDYLFSIDYHNKDELLCPLCGTIHNNSAPFRASILSDKDQAIDLIESLNNEIKILDEKLSETNSELKEIRNKIEYIRNKYNSFESGNEKTCDFDIFNMLTIKNFEKHIQDVTTENSLFIEKKELSINEIQKQQKNLQSKEQDKKINDLFIENLTYYIKLLNADGVNLESVKSPMDYNKLSGSGGAAESTRALLAYYMAVLKLVEQADNEVFAPIIIDTPNQQEQANLNYKNILKFLVENIHPKSQLILCAMDCEEIELYKGLANIIQLDNEKILKKSEYNKAVNLLNMDIYN